MYTINPDVGRFDSEGGESEPFPAGLWTQITLVRELRKYSLYFDNVLASSYDIKGTVMTFGDDMFFGGDPWLAGATGSKYDNIQVFNKALTLVQITELALANEGVVVG